MSVKGAPKRERQRCVNIVVGHRARIVRRLLTSHGPNSKVLCKVIELLRLIERDILDIQEGDYQQDAPEIDYQGDFSAEEMERALRVMEEQDQRNNPFEG